MCCGSSAITSSARVTSFAPGLINWLGAKLTASVALPGTQKPRGASLAVINEPLCFFSRHDHHSQRHAGNNSVPLREILRCWMLAGRKLSRIVPALQDFLEQLLVFFPVQTSLPAP